MNKEDHLRKRLFAAISNERYAGNLINSVIMSREHITLNKKEKELVYDAYDNAILFSCAGFKIKGENTHNIRAFIEIIIKYWNVIKTNLSTDAHNYILLEMV